MNIDALDWKLEGACSISPTATDEEARLLLDAFFPAGGADEETKKLCHGCPVEAQCFDYAMVNRIEHGLWGGTLGYERRRLWQRTTTESDAAA